MRRYRAIVAVSVTAAAGLALGSLTTGTSPLLPAGLTPAAAAATTASTTSVPPYRELDPATWTPSELAAELTFVCLDVADTSAQRTYAAKGVGGIAFLGSDAPSDLRTRLRSVRAATPHGIPPLIASDEEGGEVQRLAKVIYPLPSAETMGTWSTSHIRSTAYEYAQHMADLGVPMAFAPVADLGIPGYYIESLHRAFSRYPSHVSADVTAWDQGMHAAGVLTTVKHWPGHGQATNTHTGAATVPPLSTLEKRDMIPFNDAFANHVPAVMVGHLMSDGLTDPGWPASESPKALKYLRARAGWKTLIVTDSLSMAAASSAVHRTVPQAAVRALHSGADIALTCAPSGVISAISSAISGGTLHKYLVVASVRRLLPLKARVGLLPGYKGPWATTVTRSVSATTVPVHGTDTLSGTASGGYRQAIVEEYTSSGWHRVRGAVSGRSGRFHVSLPTGTVGTHKFRVYLPTAFPYGSALSKTVTVTVTS